MAEYASNSNRSKEAAEQNDIPEQRARGVAQGRKGTPAPEKKGFSKFLDRIVKSETGEDLEGYFMRSVADMICHGIGVIADLISDTVNIKFTGSPVNRRSGRSGARASYRQYYEDDDDDDYRPRKKKQRVMTVENYEDVIFDDRGEAETALEELLDILDKFNVVSVKDLYDASRIKGADYQTNKFGWTDLDGAHVVRIRDDKGRICYTLALPKPTSI